MVQINVYKDYDKKKKKDKSALIGDISNQSRTNVVTVGCAIKSSQKYRIFHYLKRYKQNWTLRAKVLSKSTNFPTKGHRSGSEKILC